MLYRFKGLLLLAACIHLTVASALWAGYALRINPNDRNQAQRVTIPDSRSLDIDGQGLTMEAWIRVPRPEQDVELTFLNKESTYEMRVRANNVQMAVMTNGRWAWEGGGRIDANRWTHVAGVYDGQFVRIYINGQQTGATARQGNINPSDSALYVGTRPLQNFIHNYQGDIDELRVWNVARTPEQLRAAMNVMLSGREQGLAGYWRFDEGEGQIARDRSPNGNHGFLGVSPQNAQNDPVWIDSDAPLRGGEMSISREEISFGPVANGFARSEILALANTSEEEGDAFDVSFRFEAPDGAPEWLTFEPSEGRLAAGETVNVEIIATPDGVQPAEVRVNWRFIHDAVNLEVTEIPITLTIVDGTGLLSGMVASLATGDPVADAVVEAEGDFSIRAVTDEEGAFLFENLPAFSYRFRVTARDFLPFLSDTLTVRDGDRMELNPRLRHAQLRTDPARIELFLQTDDTLSMPLGMRNTGNGPLTWTLDLNFPDVEGLEPWAQRAVLAAGDSAADNRIGGVEFINDHFYVAGGNNGQAQNFIYVFNREGSIVRRFPQPAESNFGMRDLAWDGANLWGADNNMVYGFNLDGEVQGSFNDPVRPSRAIAWDPERELLWLASVTTDIVGVDRDGNEQARIRRIGRLRLYGLAWMPEAEDGYNLYLAADDPDSAGLIYRVNPENGDARFAARLDAPGRLGGNSITGIWDPYNWTMLIVHDGPPDVIRIWQMRARTDWLIAEPTQGVLDAGDRLPLNMRFNTFGLPVEEEFRAILQFNHDGVAGRTEVPVSLNVTSAGGISQRVIELSLGWNLISTNVQPEQVRIDRVFADLIGRGLLHLVKDHRGRFWNPEIGWEPWDWNVLNGILVRVNAPGALTITGEVIPPDRAIPVEGGWNMVAYLPRRAIAAEEALANLGENLILAKDRLGRFYWPQWGYSNMGVMREGNGYQLRLSEDGELVYNLEGAGAAASPPGSIADQQWIQSIANGGGTFSLLLRIQGTEAGARLEAHTPAGYVAGRGIVDHRGWCGMALWGDDPTTESTDGFRDGEEIQLRRDGSERLLNLLALDDGEPRFVLDGWGAFKAGELQSPAEFRLYGVFPNPFNNRAEIRFALMEAGPVALTAFDLNGRKIMDIAAGHYDAGRHRINWSAEGLPSGLYIIQLAGRERMATVKALLVR